MPLLFMTLVESTSPCHLVCDCVEHDSEQRDLTEHHCPLGANLHLRGFGGTVFITLTSPSGAQVVLGYASTTGSFLIFNGTIWSDQSVNEVWNPNVLQPLESLNALVGGGQEVNGNWNLQIQP